MRFLTSLRGKLIITYTLVTVLALLALEVLVLGMLASAGSLVTGETGPYLQDVVDVLPAFARSSLTPTVNISGLQNWLEQTYESGHASLAPADFFDSPAAIIVKDNPMYVLAPDGTVLAQAPAGSSSLVGRKYTPPYDAAGQKVLKNALSLKSNANNLSMRTPDGNYLVAVPVADRTYSEALSSSEYGSKRSLLAVIIVTVKPPPTLIWQAFPIVFAAVLVTALLLLMAVTPFGALFGFIMSRGLTRRLKALTQAADAWSEGNFSVQPKDRSQDEIGHLGMRMHHMAERLQALLQAQHELAMMEERNRLARELHDTVKQQTFATLMQVRAAKNLLEGDPCTARQHLEEAEGLIKTSQQELGLMIAELRPAALEGQGLAQALKAYLDTWSEHSRIPATFAVQNERRLPLDVEQALYRVAQEALSNVARHSRASAADVRLSFLPGQVSLVIADNGVGFDPKVNHNGGFGLQSMKDRLSAMSGGLTIKSTPDEGTRVIADIPTRNTMDSRP